MGIDGCDYFSLFEKFIWPVLDSPPSCDQTCILKNLLHFPTLLMLIFPFIWGIRILMGKEKQEILREDYYRRALIEATLQNVFDPLTPSDDTPGLKKQNRKVWAKYISRWSEHSPAEMMLQYLSKDKGQQHPQMHTPRKLSLTVTKKPDARTPLTLFPLPVGMRERFGVIAGERRAAENMIRCLFPCHDRRRVEIAVGDPREDR